MFRIRFIPEDYRRVLNALDRVLRTSNSQADILPYLASVDCLNLLRRNIMTQKYAPYAPYNPRYRLWKEQYGAPTGFWVLFGDLVKALSSWKEKDKQWIAGIPAGVKDSGGKSWFGKGDKGDIKSIAMIAHVMEFGGSFGKGGHHPPRPLFVPTMKEYEKEGLPKRIRESTAKVKGSWH